MATCVISLAHYLENTENLKNKNYLPSHKENQGTKALDFTYSHRFDMSEF